MTERPMIPPADRRSSIVALKPSTLSGKLMQFLRDRWLTILGIIATVSLMAIPIFSTTWSNPVISFFFIAVVLSIIGQIDGLWSNYRSYPPEKEIKDFYSLEKELRNEKQAHADSKISYLKTLESCLEHLLTLRLNEFDHRCRVTIYKLQTNDDKYLRRIFRFSPTSSYHEKGRIRVPVHEGVVGVAWKNHGVKEVKINMDPNSGEFQKKMNEELIKEGCKIPSAPLSMPSRYFYARALEDHDTGKKIAIVIYECTRVAVLKKKRIDDVLESEKLDVSRLVKHLGVLRGEFDPDAGKGDDDG